MHPFRISSPFAAIVALAAAALADDKFPPMPPVKAQSPAETIASIQLPPGYRLELVLSEPEIKEPVIAAFDGNGRMFIAEMRSYMQEIDGKNELDPVSRVSLHWSSKGDGAYDKHTVFADGLRLPRMLLPLDKGTRHHRRDGHERSLHPQRHGRRWHRGQEGAFLCRRRARGKSGASAERAAVGDG